MKNDTSKLKNVLKYIMIVCGVILFIEAIYLVYLHFSKEDQNTYFDSVNAMEKLNDGYVAVGSSDFKHSKDYKWTQGYEKARLAKYDKDQKLIWEKQFSDGYNTTFYDVVLNQNGYIAVGTGEFSEEQNKNNLHDALIVKYDQDGKQVWEKKFQVLGNSKFTKVQVIDNIIYVIGRSIFPPMDIGIDERGGGVILKYDQDGNELGRANYGGSKSGIFNDFVVSSDGLYLVGKDAVNTGILVKMNFNLERQWVKNYSYTDSLGFSGIVEYNNELIVVGAKKVKEDKDDYDTDALFLKYNKQGKLLIEKTYPLDGMERYNGVVMDQENNFVVVGQTAVKDEKESDNTKNVFRYNGLYMKYDSNGKILVEKQFGGSRDDYFTGVLNLEDTMLVYGYSNSKDQDVAYLKGNGKDYKIMMITFDKEGNKK